MWFLRQSASRYLGIITIVLLCYGLFAMYSISIYESNELTKRTSNYFYFWEHATKAVIAIIVAIISYVIPRKTYKKLDIAIFITGLLFVLLLFTWLGDNAISEVKKVRQRIIFAGTSLQPWEFYKIGAVFLLNNRLIRKKQVFSEVQYFFASMLMICVICLPYMFMPDFGSFLIVFLTWCLLYRYHGGKVYYLVVTALVWIWFISLVQSRITYINERITYFLDPSLDKTNKGVGYQINNALLAVGSGWFWWRWYGKGLQKFWSLPESQGDFIFAAFLEEVGMVWGMFLLAILFAMIYVAMQTVSKLDDNYDQGMVIGFIGIIIMQSYIHMAVNVNLMPLTGVTLPFVSHGGSSLIVSMIMIALVIKIFEQLPTESRTIPKKTLAI
jgi:cell division protein FtsW